MQYPHNSFIELMRLSGRADLRTLDRAFRNDVRAARFRRRLTTRMCIAGDKCKIIREHLFYGKQSRRDFWQRTI